MKSVLLAAIPLTFAMISKSQRNRRKGVTITFAVSENTAQVAPITGLKNSRIKNMPVLSREGHYFMGCFSKENPGPSDIPVHDFFPQNDTTVYPCWVQEIKGMLFAERNPASGRKHVEITSYPEDAKALTIPRYLNGIPVTHIGPSACRRSSLSGVLEIPEGITTIGSNAFDGCTGLTGDLTIPSSVTMIGKGAFRGCTGFNGKLSIPHGVQTIGDRTFAHCNSLTGDLTLPASITVIGEYVFSCCSGLNGKLTLSPQAATIGRGAFFDCSGLTGALTIPSGVVTIEDNAFRNCSALQGALTLAPTVRTISNSAFEGCKGLSGTLSLLSGITSIGEYAFCDCTGLSGPLMIPPSITRINSGAFCECIGLSGVLTIHSNVAFIGLGAFHGCANLTAIFCESTDRPSAWDDIWKLGCPACVYWGRTWHYDEAIGLPIANASE